MKHSNILVMVVLISLFSCSSIDTEQTTVSVEVSNNLILYGSFSTDSIHIVDYSGQNLRTIDSPYSKPHAKLLDSRLFVISAPSARPSMIKEDGTIFELDRNGNILFLYQSPDVHHDVTLTDDGSIVTLAWEKMSSEHIAELPFDIGDKDYYIDTLIEVDYDTKEILWTWHAQDHLDISGYDFRYDPKNNEYTHLNAIEFLPEGNSLIGVEGFLLSSRDLSLVFAIGKETGEVLWESGQDIFVQQHNPTLLDNGNILVFDNKGGSKGKSRVVELNPISLSIEWSYELEESTARKTSGAQRLGNGNTFITHGPLGKMIEVDTQGEIVFTYTNPYGNDNNEVFRSYSYPESELAWFLNS